MSGTSLDGIDICCCKFQFETNWSYTIEHAQTFPYDDTWKERLKTLSQKNAFEYAKCHSDLGHYFGIKTRDFINHNKIKNIDAIASHGHTIFHQPSLGFTSQIGSGAQISGTTGIKTICDFRSKDVALGGQGAPLVPIGDELLFREFDYCLNLGGIANISFTEDRSRKSFDIGFSNIPSNYLAQKLNMEFDKDGILAQQGSLDQKLLQQLNSLEYFQRNYPKSLGREYFDEKMLPLLENNKSSNQDKLTTFGHHLTQQIANFLNQHKTGTVLVTGGGAFNKYWIEILKQSTSTKIIIPDPLLINYKEALIFGFLGVLRLQHKTNTLASVTGAKLDSIGGCIYQ